MKRQATPLQRAAESASRLSLEGLVAHLGLPRDQAARLLAGEPFRGPAGLACLLTIDTVGGVAKFARPTVLLGLRANELAGQEVRVLMEVQLSLLSSGLWLLGISADGELLLTSLPGFETTSDLAAAMDLANISAWAALHTLRQAACTSRDEAAGEGAR